VLYLDAAGTGAFELAKAWLPRIELAVEARAKAPYMRVTQITDSPMGYAKILPSASPAENASPAESTTGDRNAEKLARVVEILGRDGLVVCPKELRDFWEKEERMPGWTLWNFGAIRGRDEARDVRRLIVISRPLPGPAIVELMAETIYACRVQRMPAGEWYEKSRVGRLMADGTGRLALAYHHPDPQVEAVRFAICEAELIQAIGRGRGVRRD
jgi:putative DNA primase/helicase